MKPINFQARGRSSLIGADIEIFEITEVEARRESGGRLRRAHQPPFTAKGAAA